jgi:transposase
MAVAKDHRDLACRPAATRWRVAHDNAGIAPGLVPLHQRKPPRMVLDATGGWQGALVAARTGSPRPLTVMHPRHIRDVAQATGPLATPEALDAGGIAHVAAVVRRTPRPLPDATTPPMKAWLQRRRPRLEMWVAERHRVALAHPAVRANRARHLDDRQHLMTATAEAGATRIRTRAAWRAPDDL